MKTKILHLNANSEGGAFIAADRLSTALNATGKVESKHLVFSGNPGNYALWADSNLRKKRAKFNHIFDKIDFYRHVKSRENLFEFSHASTGVDITKDPLFKEADIIHLHWINKGFISMNGLKQIFNSSKAIVWTAHDFWPFTGGCYHPRGCTNFNTDCSNCKYLKPNSTLAEKVLKKKLDIYASHSPKIIVPGKWMFDLVKQSSVAKLAEIFEIPNIVDSNTFIPASTKNIKKNDGKRRIIFSAFNLNAPKKGILDLSEAINKLDPVVADKIELILIGRPKDELPDFQCATREVGVIKNTEELISIYQQSDLMVIPSYEESFGLTAVEAQACGLPVIAYSSGQLAYNILDGQTGWLCPTGDIQCFSRLMNDFLSMEDSMISNISNAARQHAVAKFGIENVIHKYLSLYESL